MRRHMVGMEGPKYTPDAGFTSDASGVASLHKLVDVGSQSSEATKYPSLMQGRNA